jgi:glycosyltransferase involved in cell wall biosynthesis
VPIQPPPTPLPPLHIVFVAPFGLRQKTTVWARTLPLARELVATGQRATVIIPPWDSPEDANTTGDDLGVAVEQVELDGGVVGTVARMVRRIDTLSPDIVHIVKPRAHAGLVHWWLYQRRRIAVKTPRLALDIDDWEQSWTPINRYAPPLARFLAWQEMWGIRHADGISAASRWLTERAQSLTSAPVVYLPNGVPPLPAPPVRAPRPAPLILFFSRFVEVSPAWLQEFWRAMQTLVPSAELMIAGAPVQPDLAVAWHAALDGFPQVRWAGYVSQAQMRSLYADAACAIFPAAPVPLHQAKCSVRLATTLLHGVPVVASAVGEQVPYAEAGGATLVPADATPAQFAGVVAAAIASPAGVEDIAARQSGLLAAYAWPTLAARLLPLYAHLPAQPQGR